MGYLQNRAKSFFVQYIRWKDHLSNSCVLLQKCKCILLSVFVPCPQFTDATVIDNVEVSPASMTMEADGDLVIYRAQSLQNYDFQLIFYDTLLPDCAIETKHINRCGSVKRRASCSPSWTITHLRQWSLQMAKLWLASEMYTFKLLLSCYNILNIVAMM